MAMTSKLVLQEGLRAARAGCLPRAGAVRVPGSYDLGRDRGLELLFAQDVDPHEVACVVLETVQGEGGFIPMPPISSRR
jgi:hypothetical protein